MVLKDEVLEIGFSWSGLCIYCNNLFGFRIFDCADRWELRFSEIFNVLKDNLGKELLKETIRIKQVRDIFGIRAVDEIRTELNIS